MSMKARVKRIESKLPGGIKAAAKMEVSKEVLLFMDYENFRKVYVEWIMARYLEQDERAAALLSEIEQLIESLEPKTKPSQVDDEALQKLMAVKVVDYMEEHGIEDLDSDKWERVMNEY